MTRLREADPWQPAKISEMMLEFAAPLLDLASDPRTAEQVRHVMHVASLCWNARFYEELGDGQFMRAVEALVASAPPEVRAGIESMLDDRRTRFADVPFAVLADVSGESAEEIRVMATAYVPSVSSESSRLVPRVRPERSGAVRKSAVRMWKRAVDDPTHPDHDKVRSVYHDDLSFVPAFPRREPVRRVSTKPGANDPCACGSGKKFKRCCRSRSGVTSSRNHA